MKTTFSDVLQKTVSVLFFSFILIILYVQIRTYLLSFEESKPIMVCAFFVLLFLAFLPFIFKKHIKTAYQQVKKTVSRLSVPSMLLLLAVFSVATKIACIYLFRIDSSRHPDIEMYWSFIRQLSTDGMITENVGYANSYYYTVIYSLLYLPLAKLIGTNNILLFNVCLSVLFTIASLLLFDTIKYYKGKDLAFVSVLLWNVLPTGMMEPLILVHENGFVFLHIVTIWILFRLVPAAKKTVQKYALVLLGAFILAYATLFNKFGLIVMIAYAIVSFFTFAEQKKKNVKTILAFGLPIVIIISCYLGGSYCSAHLKERIIKSDDQRDSSFSDEINVPYAWGLYVGANYESHGGWTDEDRNTFGKRAEFDTAEDAREYQITLVRDRFRSLCASPITLIHHIFNKLGSLWGSPFIPLSYDIGGPANTFLLHWKDGILFKLIIRILYLLNIAMSIVIVFSQFSQLKGHIKEQSYITYLKLFLIGCTIAVLPFEVSSKYMSHTIFIVAILTADSFGRFIEQTDRITTMISHRQNRTR